MNSKGPYQYRIDRVNLENFRYFRNSSGLRVIELDPASCNVITSYRKSGKTSVMKAICLGIKQVFFDQDVLFWDYTSDVSKPVVSVDMTVAGEAIKWHTFQGRSHVVEDDKTEYIKNILHEKWIARETLPVFGYYGDDPRPCHVSFEDEMFIGYHECFSPGFHKLRDWFKDPLEKSRCSGVSKFQIVFSAIKFLFDEMTAFENGSDALSKIRDLHADWSIDLTQDLKSLHALNQIYDEASPEMEKILNITSDIARRCVQLNPQLGWLACQLTPGIIMIDETRLWSSLHQIFIIDKLMDAFPLIQFINCTMNYNHSYESINNIFGDALNISHGFKTHCLDPLPKKE